MSFNSGHYSDIRDAIETKGCVDIVFHNLNYKELGVVSSVYVTEVLKTLHLPSVLRVTVYDKTSLGERKNVRTYSPDSYMGGGVTMNKIFAALNFAFCMILLIAAIDTGEVTHIFLCGLNGFAFVHLLIKSLVEELKS